MAEGDDKTFDVNRPGSTPADATARPIITPRTRLKKDPMVAETSAIKSPSAQKESAPAKKRDETKVPEPTAGTKPPSQPDETSSETSQNDKKPDEPSSLKDSTSQSPAEPPAASEPKAESSDSAAVEAVAADAANTATAKENTEEAAKRAALQKLIESKQYHVVVQQPKSQRSLKWLLIIVAVVIIFGVAAWLLSQ